MALNENVKNLIRSVVNNDLSKAKSYVKVILENENAASNKSFCDYMKKELETQPNFIELPYDIKEILKMEEKTANEIEDTEIEDFLKYLKVASEVAKEKGKHYKFKCPLCGGEATSIRNTYNGHLWSKCEKCDMQVVQ